MKSENNKGEREREGGHYSKISFIRETDRDRQRMSERCGGKQSRGEKRDVGGARRRPSLPTSFIKFSFWGEQKTRLRGGTGMI